MDKHDQYNLALEGKEIPILTLDNKWHRLFTQTGETKEIKKLTEEVNELLKRQGKLNTDMKDVHKLKKKLMNDIMSSMDEDAAEGGLSNEENKRLIEECNEKLEAWKDEALELPRELNEANHKLMLATMEVCYERLQTNSVLIDEIAEWVAKTRVELKTKLIQKQQAEIMNHELYSYMHDIFGAEVIDIFDMKYTPSEKKPAGSKEEPKTDSGSETQDGVQDSKQAADKPQDTQ
ncbi:MAG: hypothetical protein E7300_07890 [Lachnospiraceae bacterium]|nr:hypothetical protein [Lachnospiraceae bacterium]